MLTPTELPLTTGRGWLFDADTRLPTAVTVDDAGRLDCSCVDDGERRDCCHVAEVRRLMAA